MNPGGVMQACVQRYLDERRRLGFELKSAATELRRFAGFADARGHQGPLTLELQLDWAREPVRHSGVVTAARRLEVVRPFAAHYRQFEPGSEVPPTFILGHGHRRLAPHIYTDQEIRDLLDQAGRLSPQGGLRPLTYQTLFGLIAATGLRISEALKLRVADLDLPGATLTVRQTKFHKSRCLPVHGSVVQALSDYLHARQRWVGCATDTPVFVTQAGRAPSLRAVHDVFAHLQSAGELRFNARPNSGSARPSIRNLSPKRQAGAAWVKKTPSPACAKVRHGMGDKLFALPWAALTLDTANKRFTLGVPKEVQKDAPRFDKKRWP